MRDVPRLTLQPTAGALVEPRRSQSPRDRLHFLADVMQPFGRSLLLEEAPVELSVSALLRMVGEALPAGLAVDVAASWSSTLEVLVSLIGLFRRFVQLDQSGRAVAPC